MHLQMDSLLKEYACDTVTENWFPTVHGNMGKTRSTLERSIYWLNASSVMAEVEVFHDKLKGYSIY